MKVEYRGFEIHARKERCICGDLELFTDVVRISDGFIVIENADPYDGTVRGQFPYLKERIDAELASDDPWGEKADGWV